jgi:hypothetical protein
VNSFIAKNRFIITIVFIYILLACTAVIFGRINLANAAYSASGKCYFGPAQNCNIPVVECEINDVFSGRNGCSGEAMAEIKGGSSNEKKEKFINYIENRLTAPLEKDRKGARYVIMQITGDKSRTNTTQFKKLIRQDSVRIEFYESFPFDVSSYWDPNTNGGDIIEESSYPTRQFRDAIIITQKKNGILDVIGTFEITCGNPVAVRAAEDLTNDYYATLDLDNTVSTPNADVTNSAVNVNFGGTVNISDTNINDAPFKNTASYDWEYRVNGTAVSGGSGTVPFTNNNVQVNYSFTRTFAQGSPAGDYCGEMVILRHRPVQNDFDVVITFANQVCVRVTSTPAGTAPVYMNSVAQGGSSVSVEPEQGVNSGRLWNSVTNTPQLNNKEWGYIESAVQLGATRIYESERGTGARSYNEQRHLVDVAPYSTYQSTPCSRWDPGPNGYWGGGDDICTQPGGTIETRHCENDSCDWYWYDWDWDCNDPYTRYMGRSSGAPTCNSQYSRAPCADGTSPNPEWRWPGTAQPCNDTWRCQYGELFVGRGQPRCEYRCSGGYGSDRARLSSSKIESNGVSSFETWGSPDLRCFRPWQVTLTCTYNYIGSNWYSRDPANGMPGSVSVTVNADSGQDLGNLCSKNISYYGGFVGDTACAQINTVISAFQTNNGSVLSPNQRLISNGLNWSTRTSPATATQCYQTIARPFVSFNKTDVRATGGYINAWGAWNGTSGYGTTVDYAIYATTWIDGISSNKASPTNSSPKTRTFANNDGSVWGGNFTSSVPSKFDQFVVTIGAGKPCTAIPSSITASQVINCAGSTATIGSNIDTSWTYTSPKNLYIIADTINISGGVTSLNGVGLIARNINTCSDGVNNCASNLNLTGFINSDSVRYGRAANTSSGSSFYCVRPTRSSDLPGWVARTCDRYTSASEVITYSPTFEISPAPYTPTNGPRSGKYDSIRALPPIY